jgi:hypothetical protein
VFLVVLLLKWALVFASARHWVLSDAHPIARWIELPGPRGWLAWTLLVLAVPAFPVWISFHAGTIGTLLAAITGTRDAWGGNASLIWGLIVLGGVFLLTLTGGYARLEKIQSAIVALLIVSVLGALVRLEPDWLEVLAGFLPASSLAYPAWARDLEDFTGRPVWVEVATYAGVIGGSGYDYLAYVSWLRDKHGAGSERRVTAEKLRTLIAWDATVSFATVLIFSAAFVICGALILAPQHQAPRGSDLLTLQVQFVQVAGRWLTPLYFTGAVMALAGTLYGTLEVAPAVLRELAQGLWGEGRLPDARRLRKWAVTWCGIGGFLILLSSLVRRSLAHEDQSFNLVALITPANLVTGVLACGWMSLLNVWADRRFLPAPRRMGVVLMSLNLLGGLGFCAVGIKAAWDQTRWLGPALLLGSFLTGLLLAALTRRWSLHQPKNHDEGPRGR